MLDRMQPVGNNTYRLGWETTPSSPAKLQSLPMTTQNIQASASALLMFNYGLFNQISTFNYTINGHANSAPSPVPSSARGMRSVALNVPLNVTPGPMTSPTSEKSRSTMVIGNEPDWKAPLAAGASACSKCSPGLRPDTVKVPSEPVWPSG